MSNFDMYQNTGYSNKRNRKRTLILDIDDSDNTHLGSGSEFNIQLFEAYLFDLFLLVNSLIPIIFSY